MQYGDFKQLGTKCGGHGKNCAEVSRHRSRCDLPCATKGRTAKCCSDSSVVCLRDFVLVCILATASHGVGTGVSGHVSVLCDRGGPRSTREKKRSQQTRMPGRRVPGWTRAGHGMRPTIGRPTFLATVEHQARCAWMPYACMCPTYMRHCACGGVERVEDGRTSIRRSQSAGGDAREKLRRCAEHYKGP